MIKISLPRHPFLKIWVLWIIAKCTLKISYELNSAPALQKGFSNFVYEFILPWVSGAMWSSFKPIQYLAIFLAICQIILVLFRADAFLIKKLVWTQCAMAIYTIWLDDWIASALDPLSTNSITITLQLLLSFLITVDIGFTLAWLLLSQEICRQLDRNF